MAPPLGGVAAHSLIMTTARARRSFSFPPWPGPDEGADVDSEPRDVRTDFETGGGVRVTRTAGPFDPDRLSEIARAVDDRRGGVLSSGMEYPGRYSRWHIAYADPCVEIVARGRRIGARALNDRGRVVLPVIAAALQRAGTLVTDGTAHAGTADAAPAWPWTYRSRTGPTPKRSAAAAPPCSARSARSSPRSAAETPIWACTGRSATTWPSSSSRCGCGWTGPTTSVTWCCTCRTRSTCWTASGKRPPGSATNSPWTGSPPQGLPRLTERTTPPAPPPPGALPEQPRPGRLRPGRGAGAGEVRPR